MSSAERFADLLELARVDSRVLGLFLSGSRGKGALVTPRSDYDLRVVVDTHAPDLARRFATRRGNALEVALWTLEDFEAYAEPGSSTEWDRYSFTHVRVLVDRCHGEIQRLVDRKGKLGADEALTIAARTLDAYTNSLLRSLKGEARGEGTGARLDAAESVPHLLAHLFALEGRVRPFNAYLRWELDAWPLEESLFSADRLLPRLERILEAGRAEAQSALFRDVERQARRRGHAAVIDSWVPDLALLRGLR